MRIYLSAPEAAAKVVEGYAEEFRDAGHQVASTWHEPGNAWTNKSTMELVPAMEDAVAALHGSDVLVAFVHHGDRTRSTFEMGQAAALGLHVHLVGRPDGNRSYDLLPLVTRWQSWPHLRRGSQLFPDHAHR